MEGFKKMGTVRNIDNSEGLKDKESGDGRRIVPFHVPSTPRPQDQYNIAVNNSNMPFEHVWLEKTEDGSRFLHPMEKLSVLDFVDGHVRDGVPVKLHPIENTPFKLVEGVKELKELATKLWDVNEFAIDLEHNQYRSFQGLTCLMQISTRTEDFVIDTIKLRLQVGPYLREVFKDPSKRKVMHGADRDILWLQRDFGIYICNLFDTGQASKVMQLERNSLEYLLTHFCGIIANKEYQNADWRVRPLPDEMLKYAREDTHYLLHMYDLMKSRLLSMPSSDGNREALLVEVYKRSNEICMQLYEKELLTDSSFIYIYGLQEANFNSQQLSIVSGLYKWRDSVARKEDESTGYILPNKTLLKIAREKPLYSSELRRLVKFKSPYVDRNVQSVIKIIMSSIQNASAFVNLAELLKMGQQEARYEQQNEADLPRVEDPMISTLSRKDIFHGSDNSRIFKGPAHMPASLKAKDSCAKTAARKCREQERLQRLPLPEVGCFFKPSNIAEENNEEKLQRLPLPEVGCFFKPSNIAEENNEDNTDNGSTKFSKSATPAIVPTYLNKATSGVDRDEGSASEQSLHCDTENGSLKRLQSQFEERFRLQQFHCVATRQHIKSGEPQEDRNVGAYEFRNSRVSGEVCNCKGHSLVWLMGKKG